MVFQRAYTDAKFVEVQKECQRLLYCNGVGEKKISDTCVEHLISDRVWILVNGKELPLEKKRRVYRVTFDINTHDIQCSCKLFETHGIMCRHTLKVYDIHEVTDVPHKYILDRWNKNIPRKHLRVKVAYHDPSKTVEVKRCVVNISI